MNPIELIGLILIGLFTPTQPIIKEKSTIQNIPEYSFNLPLAKNCENISQTRGFSSYHNGVDFTALGQDCDIVSVAPGIVEQAEWGEEGQGYYVEIKHNDEFSTRYFHGNGNYYVKVGDVIAEGDRLMQMGCTGHCTSRHLHFILLKNGEPIDPATIVHIFDK